MSQELLNFARNFLDREDMDPRWFADEYMRRCKQERDNGKGKLDAPELSRKLSTMFCLADQFYCDPDRAKSELDESELRREMAVVLTNEISAVLERINQIGGTLEAGETQHLRVKTALVGTDTELILSGFPFHLELAVESISSHQQEDEIMVLARLLPAGKVPFDTFEYRLTIPATVNRVSFGSKRQVVWKRAEEVGQS